MLWPVCVATQTLTANSMGKQGQHEGIKNKQIKMNFFFFLLLLRERLLLLLLLLLITELEQVSCQGSYGTPARNLERV